MKEKERADVYHFGLGSVGASLILYLTIGFEKQGRRCEDEVIEINGVRVRQLRVYGKRPDEGKIAAHVKANPRDKRKA